MSARLNTQPATEQEVFDLIVLFLLGMEFRSRNSQNTGIAGMGGEGLTLAWIFVKDLSACTEGPQR